MLPHRTIKWSRQGADSVHKRVSGVLDTALSWYFAERESADAALLVFGDIFYEEAIHRAVLDEGGSLDELEAKVTVKAQRRFKV